MSDQITVTLPDGSERTVPDGSTAADLAAAIGPGLAKAALVAEIDGRECDLDQSLVDGAAVRLITAASDEGREVLRHSTSHVLAQAVLGLFPGAKFAIGPAIADGFYYDFDLPGGRTFTDDDLAQIEAKMREIISADQPFVRAECSIEQGLELFADQPYKREIIERVDATGTSAAGTSATGTSATGTSAVETGAAGTTTTEIDASEIEAGVGTVSTYRNTDAFVDLCRGPHVPSTGRLGSFKLMKVAGAYWRGDEKGPMLQRIYGTAWESDKALKAHLHRLEEAEKRDHRKLGVELDLFSFPDEIGSGLAVFHPKGGLVRRLMEDYSRERHEQAGYEFVYSPHITKSNLFETSGHLDWYADGMYPPMELDGGTEYYLKPMNCPFHILIYKSRQRSYRELPLRLFEFGTVYRYEKSGVVHGLTRVRGMTQDDAHIFCTKDQMVEELQSLLHFVLDLLRDYGLDDFYLELSTRPAQKAVGGEQEWAEAIEALRAAAEAMDLDLVMDEGGGAFYGPKISVQVKDAIGRTWQMSTIQLDFQLPRLFELAYVGTDNERHQPIMIHRALFGSIERFFGVLLEHYAGAFPAWLAPEQVRILPVRADHETYALRLADRLRSEGFRADVAAADEPLGGRIRKAKLDKLPYVLVVGDDDVEHGTVGVNPRGGEVERDVVVGDFVKRLAADVVAHV